MEEGAAEGPQCRICWGGPHPPPAGLADVLVSPCACRGTLAHVHLSCLHAWQVHRFSTLQDGSRCDVCGQPYRVPAVIWQAAVAGGAVDAGERRHVEVAWKAANVMQGAAVRHGAAAFNRLAKLAGTIACTAAAASVACAEVAQLMLAGSPVSAAPQHSAAAEAGALMPFGELAHESGTLALSILSVYILRDYFYTRSWQAVRQGKAYSLLRHTALAAAGLAAALGLQWLCAADRTAPGAPAQQPLPERLADLAVFATRALFAAQVARVNCFPRALVVLLPGGQDQRLYNGEAWAAVRNLWCELVSASHAWAAQLAFQESPAALRTLCAALACAAA